MLHDTQKLAEQIPSAESDDTHLMFSWIRIRRRSNHRTGSNLHLIRVESEVLQKTSKYFLTLAMRNIENSLKSH